MESQTLFILSSLVWLLAGQEVFTPAWNSYWSGYWWINDRSNSSLEAVLDVKTWYEARKHCQELGGDLAVVDEKPFNQFKNRLGSFEYWIGLNDLRSEGDFVWVDGRGVNWTHWRHDQPNGNAVFDQDCITLDTNQWWQDKACQESHGFLCEIFAAPVQSEDRDLLVTFADVDTDENMTYSVRFSLNSKQSPAEVPSIAIQRATDGSLSQSQSSYAGRFALSDAHAGDSVRNTTWTVSANKDAFITASVDGDTYGVYYLPLPLKSLGAMATDYFVFSNMIQEYLKCIRITALYAGTSVLVDFRDATIINNQTVNQLAKVLDAYEQWSIVTRDSLYKTRVTANNPISVISIVSRERSNGKRELFAEQMIPIKAWGTQHVMFPLASQRDVFSASLKVVVRVNSAFGDTRLYMQGRWTSDTWRIYEAGQGRSFVTNSSDQVLVVSDKPVGVMATLYDQDPPIWDTCMMTIVPEEQWPVSIRVSDQRDAILYILTRSSHQSHVTKEVTAPSGSSVSGLTFSDRLDFSGVSDEYVMATLTLTNSDPVTFTCRDPLDNSYCHLVVYIVYDSGTSLQCTPAGMLLEEIPLPPEESSTILESSASVVSYDVSSVYESSTLLPTAGMDSADISASMSGSVVMSQESESATVDLTSTMSEALEISQSTDLTGSDTVNPLTDSTELFLTSFMPSPSYPQKSSGGYTDTTSHHTSLDVTEAVGTSGLHLESLVLESLFTPKLPTLNMDLPLAPLQLVPSLPIPLPSLPLPVAIDLSVTETMSTQIGGTPSCSCRTVCRATGSEAKSEEIAMASKVAEEIQKELVVKKTTLSAQTRKMSSMNDDRVSSQTIGALGIGLLITVILVLILPDLLSAVSFLYQKCKQ